MAAAAATRPWVVGLTGGIASGKSTVGTEFAALGATVIDLDVVSREVVEVGSALLTKVFARFGTDLKRPDGSLDRRLLRSRVFADPVLRRELEAMLHPAIVARTQALVAAATGPYVVVQNPLLAEGKARVGYDRVLVVDSTVRAQEQRLAARDGSNPQEIAAILAAQAARERRLQVADDVLKNDGSLDQLRAAVAAFHRQYLGLARHSSTIGG
jgi:dephospho-CoA kinase